MMPPKVARAVNRLLATTRHVHHRRRAPRERGSAPARGLTGLVRVRLLVLGVADMKTDDNGPVCAGDLFAFYGLLKQGATGMPTHIDLDAAGVFLGPCWFRGAMYEVDGFPGVVDGDTLCRGVRYRIHEVSVVEALDEFEDVLPHDLAASLYVRRRRPLLDVNGRETGELAWMYWYNQPVEALRAVEGGDWPLTAGRPRR